MGITVNEYVTLEQAYNFFNGCLFNDKLPQCLITYQRGKKFAGYFSPNRYVTIEGQTEVPEIALNPELFHRGDIETLSTLVHEMCHVWREYNGKTPRKAYHDRSWAEMMVTVGLKPFNIKTPEKMTGQNCSHTIINDGLFLKYCSEFLSNGKSLKHMARVDSVKEKTKKNSSKTKFTCPNCGINVWGKPDVRVICSDCYELEDGQIFTLLPEPTEQED